MNKTMIILSVLVLVAIQAKATECGYKTFQEEKINFAHCQYHYTTIRALLFKARTKVLNDYIKDKIEKGELADKKFEITMEDPLSLTYLSLTQGQNGYFVRSGGRNLSLQDLKKIVDYFAKPDWNPFLAGYFLENDYNSIDNFYKRNTTNDTIAYQPFAIWKKDGISLQYSGDSLRYVINDTPLTFKVNSNLPVKIRERYLIFQQDSICVVQDMQTIKSLKIENLPYYDVYVYSNWVNICWGSEEDWIYSYSYDKNRFYKREELQNASSQ